MKHDIELFITISSKKYGIHKVYLDLEDYKIQSQYHWCLHKRKHTFYAVRNIWINGKDGQIMMHRAILNISNSKILVDHIDHNGLNNRRNNIRVATYSQNNANLKNSKGTSSKYIGVSWNSRYGKWVSQLQKGGKHYFGGRFKSEEEAAESYNKLAIKLHGEFASVNTINQPKCA